MDLEGNLVLDRKPARRWVSAIAVMVPVVACVAGVTWFVRAFISPPTVAIPGPIVLSAAPPAPPMRAEPPAPKPESVWPAVVMSPTPSVPAAASDNALSSPPVTATLGAAPQAASPFPPPAPSTQMAAAPPAFADPAPDTPASPAAAPVVEAAVMPIAGPVPVPRPRPTVTALAAAHIPMPRPRPPEDETAAPTLNPIFHAEPDYDRHAPE